MNYGSLVKIINSLRDIKSFGQLEKQTYKQHRFTTKQGKMKDDVIKKSKFVQINTRDLIFLMELYLCHFHTLIYQK